MSLLVDGAMKASDDTRTHVIHSLPARRPQVLDVVDSVRRLGRWTIVLHYGEMVLAMYVGMRPQFLRPSDGTDLSSRDTLCMYTLEDHIS
jgi:hypothetical protein